MNDAIEYVTSQEIDPDELRRFYERQHHPVTTDAAKLIRLVDQAFCFVTARRNGELVGVARGLTDGLRGYLAECKLDPQLQGPGCVTRTDGRIEHDESGIAREMASRVVEALIGSGVDDIHVLAYGTEEDFCADLGFRRIPGMVALHLPVDATRPAGATARST